MVSEIVEVLKLKFCVNCWTWGEFLKEKNSCCNVCQNKSFAHIRFIDQNEMNNFKKVVSKIGFMTLMKKAKELKLINFVPRQDRCMYEFSDGFDSSKFLKKT